MPSITTILKVLRESEIFPNNHSIRQLELQMQLERAQKQLAILTQEPIDRTKLFEAAKKEVEAGSVILFFLALPTLDNVRLINEPCYFPTIQLLCECLPTLRADRIPTEIMTQALINLIKKRFFVMERIGLYPQLSILFDFLDFASYFPKNQAYCLWEKIELLHYVTKLTANEIIKKVKDIRVASGAFNVALGGTSKDFLADLSKLGSAAAVRLMAVGEKTLIDMHAKQAYLRSISLKKECIKQLMALRDPGILYNQAMYLLKLSTTSDYKEWTFGTGESMFIPIREIETDLEVLITKAFRLLVEAAESDFHPACYFIRSLCESGLDEYLTVMSKEEFHTLYSPYQTVSLQEDDKVTSSLTI